MKQEIALNQKEILPDWDLTALYDSAGDPKINQDLENISSQVKEIAKNYQNKIAKLTGEELFNLLDQYESLAQGIGRVSTFAYLYFVTEMTNEKKSVFYQNISEKINDISKDLIFIPLEIARIPKDVYEQQLQSKNLQKYQSFLEDIRVTKKYQKSLAIEEILHSKDQTSNSAWSKLFDETMAALKFDYDSKKLTASEIFNLLSSHEADVRKNASQAISKTLNENVRIFTFITNILAKDKSINDEIRKYPHPVKARNVSNFVEDKVVNSLVDTVKANYKDLSHRYYKYKAGLFGKQQLDYWDRNAPLPFESKKIFSWEEAKEIVLGAYDDFCPEMAEIGKRFFDNNWIDVGPKPGKDSGAFAHPATPDTHPYLMLNFQGKTRDIMTLAHELGHGVHQLLASKQGYFMSSTPLTLAETASVFGEQLAFERLLKMCDTEDERQAMIANKVEDMINTIVRQIAFYSFELEVHTKRREKELSTEELNEIWMQVQSESLGEGIKLAPEYGCYWSYIPHFIHSPFYVYAYAFGNCLVNALYKTYQDGLPNFQEKYLTMLRAGGTLHHKELLKPLGLDASHKDFWQKGIDVVVNYIKLLR